MTELETLKGEINKGFDHVNKKLDLLLNPKTGVFSELLIINNKSEKAHERLDEVEKSFAKMKDRFYGDVNMQGYEDIIKNNATEIKALKEHRENAVKMFRKAVFIAAGPILAGLGAALWALISGGN